VEKWKRGEGVDVTDMFADAPLVQNATLDWAKGPLAILAELRRMRQMETSDLLHGSVEYHVRRFCARSRVHDLCGIWLSDERGLSGTARDILSALQNGEFGPRTPAQEAYLDGVLNQRRMHDRIPAEESASDLVAGLGENLLHEKYGHVEVWDVRYCATLENAFKGVTKIQGRLDLTFWDTRKVKSMSSAFEKTAFDVDVSTWDVSAVTTMSFMFSRATGFSGDVSEWDVSKVSFMGMMFRGASTFNGDVRRWDVARVHDMDSMFEGAESFECDLGRWDVSKVKKMKNMFRNATSFKGKGVEKWKPAEGVDVN